MGGAAKAGPPLQAGCNPSAARWRFHRWSNQEAAMSVAAMSEAAMSAVPGSETITAHAAVDRFLAAIESATISGCDAWSADATLDATVPNWRFRVSGVDAIRSQYATWFAYPSSFEQLRRLTTHHGEVVEYTLTWTQDGVPHAGHHAHILTIRDDLIVADTVLCGGRWPAALLAEMEASDV
jgi:hypothetical protein